MSLPIEELPSVEELQQQRMRKFYVSGLIPADSIYHEDTVSCGLYCLDILAGSSARAACVNLELLCSQVHSRNRQQDLCFNLLKPEFLSRLQHWDTDD